MLFVQKHPNLRVRVVHGNTLTAGVIIKSLPSDVKEVFMNGATSKLGRVIALYLCSHGIRVLVNSNFPIQILDETHPQKHEKRCPMTNLVTCICHIVCVQMLTLSNDRFESIKKEAPAEFKHNLIQVTKYQAGQNCKVHALVVRKTRLFIVTTNNTKKHS